MLKTVAKALAGLASLIAALVLAPIWVPLLIGWIVFEVMINPAGRAATSVWPTLPRPPGLRR